MKKILAFWNKDLLNKLTVGILVLILASFITILIVIVRLPVGPSGQGLISMIFASATPTVDLPARYTSMAQTAIIEKTPAYLRGPATITSAFSGRPTLTPAFTATSLTGLAPSSTPTPEPTLRASPTPASGGLPFSGVNCVPTGTPSTGTVVDIPNGISARILVDGLIYSVRYIGIDLPEKTGFAEAASMVNGNLVWQKTVTLYSDPAEKDAGGSLYRYIVIDGKLINLELIKLGLVNVVDVPPGYVCLQAFLDAEQAAKSARIGQ